MKLSKAHAFALLISLFALSLVAPSPISLFLLSDHGLDKVSPLYSGMMPVPVPLADLDGDSHDEEILHRNGHVEILSQGHIVWSSPQEWQIAQAEITDLNRDHLPEVTLLLWRTFAPWPIDTYLPHPGRIQDFHNQNNKSCHLILVGFHRDGYREIWAGSAMADPLLAFTSADLTRDGYQELIALESRYDASLFESSSLTVWEWNGFGFTLLSRGPQGYFSALTAVQTSTGQELLLAEGFPRR
jgi:hypothetical protein